MTSSQAPKDQGEPLDEPMERLLKEKIQQLGDPPWILILSSTNFQSD